MGAVNTSPLVARLRGYPSLEAIAADASHFPENELRGCKTALMLFCAAFMGRNDCIWVAQTDIVATCVDTDGEKLAAMGAIYPEAWTFTHGDAWQVATRLQKRGETFDLVVCDTWTGDLLDRVLASLDLWTSLANRVVLTTYKRDLPYETPAGWRASVLARTTNVEWLRLKRAR